MEKQSTSSGFIGSWISRTVPGPGRIGLMGLLVVGIFAVPALANNGTITQYQPDISGQSFPITKYGSDSNRSSQVGTTRLETSNGDGNDFFVYVLPNSALKSLELEKFPRWKIMGLSTDFPDGFHVDIQALDKNGRASSRFGNLTQQAPDRLFVAAEGEGYFELGWKAGETLLGKGDLMGWRIRVHPGARPQHVQVETFTPYIRGRNHEPIMYGGSAMCNTRYGTTRLETSQGDGKTFFIYLADNVNADADPKLSAFETWTLKNLKPYFPDGFTVTVTPLAMGERPSDTLGAITRDAPDEMKYVVKSDDEIVFGWKSGSYGFSRKSIFGWRVELHGK